MGRKGEENWVVLTTRKSGSNINCFRCSPSYVKRMQVDGVDVTPVGTYDFGDAAYHEVRLLFEDTTTLPNNALWCNNYTLSRVDIPESFVTFGESSIRGMGASQKVVVIIRSRTYPTFGRYCFVSWTAGQLYVPDDLWQTYVDSGVLSSSKIHKISDL